MKKKMNRMLKHIYTHHASDVHFVLKDQDLSLTIRGLHQIVKINDKKLNVAFFHYLKFISNLDLGNTRVPQSGNFSFAYRGNLLHFRFAYLHTMDVQSGVLRVLNNHQTILLEDLSMDKQQIETFRKWTNLRSGLVLLSGPTGSGKSTTLHAILERIAQSGQSKVITLEDPIEIRSTNYLQLQVNEKLKFTYEEGIKQLLRHDPDIIMIGEVRDEVTAKMLIRCALSGHMVFTTIHAKSCKEAIKRLKEFGIKELDLQETLTGITNQRIYAKKDGNERVCIYEIMEGDTLNHVLQDHKTTSTHENIQDKVRIACEKNWISTSQAQSDFEF